jgi:hypothetical protein
MSCVQVTIIHQIWNKYEALDGIPDGDLPPQLLRDAKGSNLLSFESAAVAPLDGLHPSVAACSRNLLAAIGTELVTNKALQIAQKVDVKVRTYRMSVRARVRAFACVCVRICVRACACEARRACEGCAGLALHRDCRWQGLRVHGVRLRPGDAHSSPLGTNQNKRRCHNLNSLKCSSELMVRFERLEVTTSVLRPPER